MPWTGDHGHHRAPAPPEEAEDRDLLIDLRRQLSLHRRREGVTTGEILFVDMKEVVAK